METFIAYWNLFTVVLGITLILFICLKLPKSWGTRIACFMLSVMSLRSLVYCSFQLDWMPSMFNLMGISSALQFMLGYAFYLYISWLEGPNKRPDFTWYHWVLPVFTLISLGLSNLLQGPQMYPISSYSQAIHQLQSWLPVKAYVVLWILQTGYYMTAVLIKMRDFPNSETLKSGLFPIFLIVGSFVSIYLVYTGSILSNWFFGGSLIWMQSSAIFKPLFILGLFVVCYRNPFLLKIPMRLFESEIDFREKANVWEVDILNIQNLNLPHQRYQDPETVLQLTDKIDSWVHAQKAFRDPDFSINELSESIGLPVSHMRFLFKEFNQLTFNDYRNLCRVKDLEELFRDTNKKHLSVEALGEICGFGSKSAMFRAVRRHFDMTPQELQYRLSISN